ncbi:MAG TPA: LPS-assembly protein LptD [Gammaproteobacteria bacterium]|nr:LPS-assembly protein LptD [Gammaproteobacteria bacterium]
MLPPRKLLFAVLLAATLARPSLAIEEDWSLCRIPSFLFVPVDEIAVDETRIDAQTIASENNESLHLVGDVKLLRRDQRIEADDIVIDKSSEEINASGNVFFANTDYQIKSTSIRVDNRNNRAEFEQPLFEIQQRHARGEADSIEKIDENRSRYRDLVYTSCDPEDKVWHLRAAELEIDRESGRGSATHTIIYLQDIPFLYLPYFQFPIDDRRLSGLLTPSIGYADSDGASLILPIYWNQAPNYDMTITPAWYGKLGFQLNTENRYLLDSHRGQIDLSYIDDREFGDSRWFQQWRHETRLPYGVSARLLLAETSDGDFFDDFSSVAPQYNDTRHLERYLRLNGGGNFWRSELLWQDYQTLDDDTAIANRPYSRLPRFTIDAEPEVLNGGLLAPVHFEWVSFERADSVTGDRSHLVQSLRLKSANSWYFFEPELQLAFTNYSLEDNPDGNSLHRALPTLGVDTGLIFERKAGSGDRWRQTLEPRLYFLYTPYEDQDDIPDFDTSLAASTYSNLFRNNRFNGADRIGDASQVTFGLASRIFDNDSGDQLLNARVGQIFYFRDREVSLNGTIDEETRSDVIAEIDLWPASTLTLSARLVYDPEQSDPEQSEFIHRDLSVNYSNQGLAANFGYYFTENELEQALVSLAYPINERWELVAKLHHSLKFDEPVENLLGISYESCCWGLKILAGQTGDADNDFAETDSSIYFEFTFKGLSQAGEDIDSQLIDAIPGYRPAF